MKNKKCFLGIYLIVILGLSACRTNSNDLNPVLNEKLDESESIYATEMQVPTEEVQFIRNEDYSYYLKKIWVVDDHYDQKIYDEFTGATYSEYPEYLSFFISQINDGYIQGRIRIAAPGNGEASPCMWGDNESKLGNFAGTIKNGVADCLFVDECYDCYVSGDSRPYRVHNGKLKLKFLEKCIEVTIENVNIEDDYGDINQNGVYLYKPLNISDYDKVYEGDCVTQNVDVIGFGNVDFVTFVVKPSGRYSKMFLTDNDGNIVYSFGYYPEAGIDGLIYSKAIVEDIDGDGHNEFIVTDGGETFGVEDQLIFNP